MFIYTPPRSPADLLGREDFMHIGSYAERPVPTADTSELFRMFLYPMLYDENGLAAPVSHNELGLDVHPRDGIELFEEFGMHRPQSQAKALRMHHEKFGTNYHIYDAAIGASGVLAVAQNCELVAELCWAGNFRSLTMIDDYAASFADSLETFISHELTAE